MENNDLYRNSTLRFNGRANKGSPDVFGSCEICGHFAKYPEREILTGKAMCIKCRDEQFKYNKGKGKVKDYEKEHEIMERLLSEELKTNRVENGLPTNHMFVVTEKSDKNQSGKLAQAKINKMKNPNNYDRTLGALWKFTWVNSDTGKSYEQEFKVRGYVGNTKANFETYDGELSYNGKTPDVMLKRNAEEELGILYECTTCGNLQCVDASSTSRPCFACRKIILAGGTIIAKTIPERSKDVIRERDEEMKELRANPEYKRELDNLKKKNKGYHVYDTKDSNNEVRFYFMCKKCKDVSEITKWSDTDIIEECDGCKRVEADPSYRGKYARDYVNQVFNNMVVLKQFENEEGVFCDCECLSCSQLRRAEHLYDVINFKIYCNYEICKTMIKSPCEFCNENFVLHGNPFTGVPITRLKERIICPKCGKEETDSHIQERVLSSAFNDNKESFKRKAEALASGLRYDKKEVELDMVTELIKEKKPLYIGTDGKEYYRCGCPHHNLQLILNKDDLNKWERNPEYHTACNERFQRMVADLDTKWVKLE